MNIKNLIQLKNKNYNLNNLLYSILNDNFMNNFFKVIDIKNNNKVLTITLQHYLLKEVNITLKYFYEYNEFIIEYKNFKRHITNMFNKYFYLYFNNKEIRKELIYKIENVLIVYK